MCKIAISKKFTINNYPSKNVKKCTEMNLRYVVSRRVRVIIYKGYKDVSKILEYDRYMDDSLPDCFEKFGKSLMYNDKLIRTTSFMFSLSHQLFA